MLMLKISHFSRKCFLNQWGLGDGGGGGGGGVGV